MTKGISETAFASQIEDLLMRFDWDFMHIKPSVMQSGQWASSMNPGGKGWLDYLCLRPPRILVIELKDAYSKLTPEQQRWFDLWKECRRDIIQDPLEIMGRKAILNNLANVKLLTIPEVYLFRPNDFDKIMEVLR